MIFGVDLGTRRLAMAEAETGWLWTISLESSVNRRHFPQETDAGDQMGILAKIAVLNEFGTASIPNNHFFCERPVTLRGPRQNVRSAVGQGLSAGAVIANLPGTTHIVENSSWKLEVVGDGHADKDAVRAWLETHQPALAKVCEQTQDGTDAFCIALFGRAFLAQAGGL